MCSLAYAGVLCKWAARMARFGSAWPGSSRGQSLVSLVWFGSLRFGSADMELNCHPLAAEKPPGWPTACRPSICCFLATTINFLRTTGQPGSYMYNIHSDVCEFERGSGRDKARLAKVVAALVARPGGSRQRPLVFS